MPSTQFYSPIVSSGRAVPTQVLEKAYEAAVAAKDLNLAALVVARADCPQSVLEKAKKSRNLQIRGSYHARPLHGDAAEGRVQALQGEKAQGAHEIAAAAATTPEELRAELAKSQSPVVLAALLSNKACGGELRREALYNLDRLAAAGSVLTPPQEETFKTALRNGHVGGVTAPEGETGKVLHDDGLVSVAIPYNLLQGEDRVATIRHHALKANTSWNVQTVVRDNLQWLPADVMNEIAAASGHVEHLMRARYNVLTEENRKRVVEIVKDAALRGDHGATHWLISNEVVTEDQWGKNALVEIAQSGAGVEGSTRDSLVERLVRLGLVEVIAGAETPSGRLARVRTSATEAELRLIIEEDEIQYDYTLQRAVMANPNLTEEIAVLLVCRGIDGVDTGLAKRFPDGDVLAAHIGHHRKAYGRAWPLLQEHEERHEIAAKALTHLSEEGPLSVRSGYSRDWRLETVQALVEEDILDTDGKERVKELLEAVPARNILRGDVDGFVASVVAQALDQHLTTPAAWEAFEVLAPECEASWGDLLSACRLGL